VRYSTKKNTALANYVTDFQTVELKTNVKIVQNY